MDPALRQAIYDKYIAPTQKQRPDYIGVEIEMPVVNLADEPVDEAVPLAAAEQFAAHFGFQITGRGTDGNFTSAQDRKTGDILSFDCCYSNLELSFGKARGLTEIRERFETYARFLNSTLRRSGYTLTGMGIHPNADINRNQPMSTKI
jgi:gamma-glutamylcysteine synthetase